MGGEKGECLCSILACVENARDEYLLESDVIHVGFSPLLVCNHQYLYWGCCHLEESDVGDIVKLFVGWYEFKMVDVELD
jgi:hypothetical protein